MAAVRTSPHVEVRAPRPGDGAALAYLWRLLWDVHEGWGGYAATTDLREYDLVAQRLDVDARARAGQPILGRHVHLVAVHEGVVVGQVEGWFDRHGSRAATPFTCEVRSLIVQEGARGAGTGRALLHALTRCAGDLARGAPFVLAAEVLDANPAVSFYERLGYQPVAFSTRVTAAPDPSPGTRATDDDPIARAGGVAYQARRAAEADALPIGFLETVLAGRRRRQGDYRFDDLRTVDAVLVRAIAAHLASAPPLEIGGAAELVAVAQGAVAPQASATFAALPLESPFAPARRAMLGRFALDPTASALAMLEPLVALGRNLAWRQAASTLELTDLPGPGSPLYDASLALGARPWSRVVCSPVQGG